jgi:hypothetical protein
MYGIKIEGRDKLQANIELRKEKGKAAPVEMAPALAEPPSSFFLLLALLLWWRSSCCSNGGVMDCGRLIGEITGG